MEVCSIVAQCGHSPPPAIDAKLASINEMMIPLELHQDGCDDDVDDEGGKSEDMSVVRNSTPSNLSPVEVLSKPNNRGNRSRKPIANSSSRVDLRRRCNIPVLTVLPEEDKTAVALFITFSDKTGQFKLDDLAGRLHSASSRLWSTIPDAKTWLWRLQGGCADKGRMRWLRRFLESGDVSDADLEESDSDHDNQGVRMRKGRGRPNRSTAIATSVGGSKRTGDSSSRVLKKRRVTTSPPKQSVGPESVGAWQHLRGKIFCDDEDKSLQFYVGDVQYSEEFSAVCCMCVPFHGDVRKAVKSAKRALLEGSFEDDFVFDCMFVEQQVADYNLVSRDVSMIVNSIS